MNLFGKYKGIVVDTQDPKNLNRVRVAVKGVLDNIPAEYLPWAQAESNTPVGKGGSSYLPAVGAKVSVRFGEGDANDPYWSGGVVEQEDDLPKATKPGRFVIYESPNKGITITVDEETEDIEIKTGKYNTTIGKIIDIMLTHTHLGNMGAPTSSVAGTVPPITEVDFKQGKL